MRVVVVGDLSFRGQYHLGDEAMSEVALTELSRRGIDVTFVAGDPELTSRMYGVPAVPRFGFVGIPQRVDKMALADAILSGVRGASPLPAKAALCVEALRSADALLIAGGGNLNTIGEHHLFERLTLSRIAREIGIPYYVTSQTVGPHLLPPDQKLVREIADFARVFGVREARTAELMRGITGDSANVVRTVDDAVLLEPASSEEHLFERPVSRYVIGSFAADARTSGLDAESYYRELAALTDEIATRADVEVLLVSHLGSLDPEKRETSGSDSYAHERIRNASTSGRLHVLPMMSARDVLALTSRAEFTVSTRYHPLIFGTGVGIPAIGIVHSYFSAVRMRGAQENSGMGDFVLPLEGWRSTLGESLLQAIVEHRVTYVKHLNQVGTAQREYQGRWWDGIVGDLRGTGSLLSGDFPFAEPVTWVNRTTAHQLVQLRISTEAVQLSRLQQQITDRETDLRQRRKTLEKIRIAERLEATEAAITQLRQEVSELRHKTRPPGAAFRDRLRLRLRRLRER